MSASAGYDSNTDFIASTYTYDVIVHAGLMFGLHAGRRSSLGKNKKEAVFSLQSAFFVLLLASLSKAVYVPPGFAVLPDSKRKIFFRKAVPSVLGNCTSGLCGGCHDIFGSVDPLYDQRTDRNYDRFKGRRYGCRSAASQSILRIRRSM